MFSAFYYLVDAIYTLTALILYDLYIFYQTSQGVRVSGCQVVMMSGCQDVRVSACQGVRMSGCQDNAVGRNLGCQSQGSSCV